jgi:MerR family copper efflux transcriptional regulator
MQIGEAAQSSGVSVKMIRHYEEIGLIPAPERRSSNYRSYDAKDVHRLRFVRRARDLGFSIDRIRELMALWHDDHRLSSEVKAIALAHIEELEVRIGQMREMAETLHRLADACEGDHRPDCPILKTLEGTAQA